MRFEREMEDIFKRVKLKVIVSEAINIAKTTFTNYMRVRTGFLRRTLNYDYNPSTGGIRIYSQAVYGRAQEFGATILPRRARRLWVPLPANLTRAGVIRQTPRDVFEKGFIAGDVFYLREKQKAIPYFKLKRVTKIRPKYWIKAALMSVDKKTVEEKTKRLLKNLLRQEFNNYLKGKGV